MKIVNKRALHDYFIVESLEAGIELTGSEVRSIKSGRLELSASQVKLLNNQLFLVNANIPRYQNSSEGKYDPIRTRRLLLHRAQIETLIGKMGQAKTTLVPVSIYVKDNFVKLQLGIGKIKKEFDKRKVIKERDHLRRVQQELRGKE